MDVRALRGPDGTLEGDARALLVGVKWEDPAKDRDARMLRFLYEFECEEGAADRRALVKALWPFCARLLAHHGEQDLAASARAWAKIRRHLQPKAAARRLSKLIACLDQARPFLALLSGYYRHVDAVWEPMEHAEAIVWERPRHTRKTPDRPPGAVGGRGPPRLVSLLGQARDALLTRPSPRAFVTLKQGVRRPRPGNPVTPRTKEVRAALKHYLDEDQQTELLGLIGILPLA